MSYIYVSEMANTRLTEYLQNEGHLIGLICRTPYLYDCTSAHPDMYACKLGAYPEAPVFTGTPSMLKPDYPENVKYNAAIVGKYIIGKIDALAADLKKAAKAEILKHLGCEAEEIDVAQGYAKCNVAVIDDKSIITSDMSIYNALKDKLDVLLISQGHIKLHGYDYGFIGGCCGRVGDEVIFNGNLEAHPDFEKIKAFIEARGLTIVYFKEYALEDVGSILEHYL